VAESDLAGTLKSEYVFFGGERVARRDLLAPTGVSYYFSDHLKTASVITDSSGIIKAESDYYPWGGELQFFNADSNHYKFTGKERDSETGLDYFGARYYANILGRFVTPDWAEKAAAVPYAEFADPQSLNLYTYVRNIPTSKIDADGHCFWDLCIGEAMAAVEAVEVGITLHEVVSAVTFGASISATAGKFVYGVGSSCYGPCSGNGPLPGTPYYKQMMADIQKQRQVSNQNDNAQPAPSGTTKGSTSETATSTSSGNNGTSSSGGMKPGSDGGPVPEKRRLPSNEQIH
jgi:RHS repeat-associated protein